MIRLIFTTILLILLSIYTVIDIIISILLLPFSKIDKVKIFKLTYSNFVVKCFLKILLFISGAKVYCYGLENLETIKNEKSIFVISNHRGIFDIIIGYIYANRNLCFVGKKELSKLPVLSYWAKKIGCLFLDRTDLRSGAKMVVDAINNLINGTSVWLCPEGTRNKSHDPSELLEFKSGAFKIPEKADSYILPIGFIGTEKVFENQAPFLKKSNVYMSIGKPYKISTLSEKDREDLGEYNRNIVKSLIINVNK